MAIIAIKEIPESVHKASEPKGIKERIMADIREAYDSGLQTFEIVGYYDSSPEYVGSCAREMAYKFLKEILFDDAVASVKSKVIKCYTKKIGDGAKYIRVTRPMTSAPAITIKGVTVGGAKRIFGVIDYEYIKHFETDLLDRTDKMYRDPAKQEELKDIARRCKLREKAGLRKSR